MKNELIKLGYELESDISYVDGSDHPRQMLDIYRPRSSGDKPLPVVIYFHGGGWEYGSKENGYQRISQVLDTGYIFVSVGYRLVEDASWPACMDDAIAALHYVRENLEGADLDKIALWGSSAGAHLACLLAGGCRMEEMPEIRCLVDFCAPVTVDLFVKSLEGEEKNISPVMKMLGGDHSETMEMAKEATVTNWIKPGYPETLLVHGDSDQIVPIIQSQILCKAILEVGSNAQLLTVKNSPHRVDGELVSEKVRQFLKKNLG